MSLIRCPSDTMGDITDGTSSTIMFGEIAMTTRDQHKVLSKIARTTKGQGFVYGELSPVASDPLAGIDVNARRTLVWNGSH